MQFAIIYWYSESDWLSGQHGQVYGWYESLATAEKTAVNLRQFNRYTCVVIKIV